MKTARESAAADIESLVAEVAERFTDDVKQGRSPSIEEYAQRHPEIAHIILQVFPALAMLDISSTAWLPDRQEDRHNAGVLGDFRLIREIGRGGMGVVFEAEQISLGRTVALKMLPYAGVLDDQHLQRFKNEARAAATLEHPHIVPVYSIGCERGVHYFTMRYIEGQSLAEVLQAIPAYRTRVLEVSSNPSALASQLANLLGTASQSTVLPNTGAESHPPLDKLDTQRVIQAGITTDGALDNKALIQNVARLGIQAAQALAYAHERGILHRDVKPGNLLLDVHGDLWVADFGLARLEQDAGITMTGDVLGTLRYLSPEQALGQRAGLDERADVYSLGVTLYEMLTLRPAFSGRDRQEILRRIATEEPPPPRQIDHRIPRDLETIVQKAICKEAAGRYQTAGQLADDLRRYLDHKPIQARRPTRAEQLVKWSRRHPSVVWATALVLLTTTIMAAVSTWQAIRATRAEQQSKASEQLALKNSRRADAISDFLINTFRSPDPARDGRTVTMAELLDRAVKEVEEEFADDKRMQADLLNAIAQSYQGLGLYRESMLLYGKVQELRSSTQGPRDPGTIDAICNYASAYESAGQFDKAIPLYQEVLRIQSDRLAADDPELLATTTKLAWEYNMSGESEKALALFQDVLRLVQAKVKTSGPAPVEIPDNDECAEDGDHSKITVKPLIENTFERLDDTGPNRKNVLVALNNLAKAFAEAGQADQAIPLYQQTLKLMQEKLGPDAHSTLSCMYNLAMAFKVAGRYGEATPIFEEVFRLRREKLGPDDPVTVSTMTCVGANYGMAGNHDKCAELFGEVLRIRRAKLGEDHPETIWAMWQYGGAQCLAGHDKDALPLFEKALALSEVNPGIDHPTTLGLMRDLAETYRVNDRFEEAILLFEGTLKIGKAKWGPDRPETLYAMLDLASAYDSAGRVDDAIAVRKERLDAVRQSRGLDHPDTIASMNDLANRYQLAGRWPEATTLREELLRLKMDTLGPSHRDTIVMKNDLGFLRILAGKAAEAEILLSEDLPDVRAHLPPDDGALSARLHHLALAMLPQNKFDGAEPLARESLQIRERTGPDEWGTFNSMSLLGGVLLGQKKYADAEPLLVSGYEGMHQREAQIRLTRKLFLRDGLERLVQLYEVINQPEKAAQWKDKLVEYDKTHAKKEVKNKAVAMPMTDR